ncbi:MAG: RNA polymerase sigma-70 factor [Cytophagales bacterium]|nr:RNA polymerase sigma-70 factor [Cytophagales bacterium]
MSIPRLHSIQNGDEQVFEKLFRDQYPVLCGYARKYLDDMDQAEEIVQEMFFNFWQKRKKLEINTSIEAYLFRSVRNACLNYLKHLKIREEHRLTASREPGERAPEVHDRIVALELQERIERVIEQLPTERKKIFKMSRYEELKYKEIAERLNLSVKTVEVQMSKALKYLRIHLSDYLSLLIILILELLINILGGE